MLCLLHPAEVVIDVVLQEEVMAGSVEAEDDEDADVKRFGVEGAVVR